MTSPFNTLPDELLAQIFLECLPHNRWRITPNPNEVPTSLTLVCQRWRSTALTLPLLWSWMRLNLTAGNWGDPGAEARISRECREVVMRSKPLPFHLMLSAEHLCLDSAAAPLFLTRLLSPASSSLTRLILHKIPLSQVHSIPQGLFPLLQSLVFTVAAGSEPRSAGSHWGGPHWEGPPITAFSDTPSLSRIAVDVFFSHNGARLFVLPWNQVTHFRISDATYPCTVLFDPAFARASPALRWLGLDIQDEDIFGERWIMEVLESVFGTGALAMEGLVTLSLDFKGVFKTGGLIFPDILQKIEFPNLQTLRLSEMYLPYGSVRDHERRCLAKLRTFTKLEYLSLHVKPEADVNTLEHLFESVPNVRALHFSTDGAYPPVVRLLNEKKNLLPHLDALILGATVGRGVRDFLCSLSLDAGQAGVYPTPCRRRVVVCEIDVASELEALNGGTREFDFVCECRGEDEDKAEAAMWMELDPGSRGWEDVGVTSIW